MTEGTIVAAGQVWADDDPRSEGRRIRITEVNTEEGWARAEVLSVARNVSKGEVGETTRQIQLDRFRPGDRGYRLVENPETT
jgi:hypothetical protein